MPYDFLKKNTPEVDAQNSLPPITIDVTEDEYNFISRYASMQEDPEKAVFDAQSAILFSRNLNAPRDYCLQNLDTLSQAQIGQKYEPTQTWWKSITNSYKIGELTIDRGDIGKLYANARHNGEDFSQYEAQMKELDAQIESLQDYVPRSWITKALKATAQSIPYTANITIARGGVGAAAQAVAAMIPGVADDIAVKAVEWITAIAGTAKTADIMWGSMYYDMINKGIDEDVAWYMSKLSGVASGAIESFLEKVVGGASRSVLQATGITGGSVLNNTVARMMANGSLGEVATATSLLARTGLTLAKVGSTGFGEGSEEFVESIKDKIAENLAYTLSDMEIPVEQDFRTPQGVKNNFNEALDDFVWGALSGIIMGGYADVVNANSDFRAKTQRGLAMQTIAAQSPTYEAFSQVVDNEKFGLKDEVFEGNDEQWEKTKQRIFNSDRVAEVRKSYFNTLGDIEESETYDEEGNATKNPRFYDEEGNYSEEQGASKTATVKKMSNGRYFSQDSEQKTAEGYSIRKFGSPDVTEKVDGKFPLYGQIEYSEDKNGITIENIRFKRGVSEEDITGMVRQFLQENPDVNVSWDATSDLERSVKESIEKANDGKLTFKSDMDPSDHQAVVDRLDTWMGDLGQNDPLEEAVGNLSGKISQAAEDSTKEKKNYNYALKNSLATVIQLLGKAEGKSGIEWLNTYIKEIRKGTDEQLGNKDGKQIYKGAVKADLDETVNRLRATIYYGKNADYSTFEHELHHVVMMQSDHRQEFSKIFDKVRGDKNFRSFLERTWSTFSGRFGKFADLDQLLEKLYRADEWSADDYEFEDSLFEAYRAQGQSYNNKPLSSFFGKIASWMRQIYRSISRNADLNPELKQYYDRLYGAEGKAYEGQDLSFNLRESDVLMYTSEDQSAEDVLKMFKDTEAALLADSSNFDADGNHLAPNGKPSNLTYKQWVTVRTPNFIKWFGDWMNDPENASKVLDDNGEPLPVYHGTPETFDIFKKGESSKKGFFFTPERRMAEFYSHGKNVMEVFLNIRNPQSFDAKGKPFYEIETDNGILSIDDIVDRAIKNDAYDGVKIKNVLDSIVARGDEYVAFNQNQIKSATDNSGEFNPDNDSILHQVIGEIGAENLAEDARMAYLVSSYRKAEALEGEGIPMGKIQALTGWTKRKDGKWRHWISDSIDFFRLPTTESGRIDTSKTTWKLGDLYENKRLYSAYPELRDYTVFINANNGSRLGFFKSNVGHINLNIASTSLDRKRVFGILMHEVQHAIQEIEGFSKGSAPENVIEKIMTTLDYLRRDPDAIEGDVFDEVLDDNTRTLLASKNGLEAKFNLYKKVLGEAEARETAKLATDIRGLSHHEVFSGDGSVDGISREDQIVILGQSSQAEAEAQRQYDEIVAKYKGTDQWLKAPNGKDTNLTERQWVQVRTQSFLDWFGDWINDPENASKVVDENGEPKIVYHGTNMSGFETFQSGEFGVFFTDDVDVAKTYVYTDRENPNPDKSIVKFDMTSDAEDERLLSGSIYAVFLNMRDPVTYDAKGNPWYDIMGKGVEGVSPDMNDNEESVAAYATEYSYDENPDNDGTIVQNVRDYGSGDDATEVKPSTVYVIPWGAENQIKSIDNVGAFNTDNSNILYQNSLESQRQYDEVASKYKGTDKWMKALNGKPTNLTERQWVMVRTPNFIRWFGDWINDPEHASKVLDENGEPKVMYHGTNRYVFGFDVFDTEYKNSNLGSHFGGLSAAQSFDSTGDYTYAVFLNIRNPLDVEDIFAQDTNFEEVHLAARLAKETNSDREYELIRSHYPWIDQYVNMSDDDFYYNVVASDAVDEVYDWERDHDFLWDTELYKTLHSLIRKSGYDGLVYYNQQEGDFDERSWVALNPNEIKSATDNTGEFDPENDSILHQTESDENYQKGLASGDIKINSDGSMTFRNEWVEIVRSLEEGLRGTYSKKTNTVKVRPSLAKRVIAAITGKHRVTGDNTSARYFKDSEGKITGAPLRYDTPEKLVSLRRALLKLAKEGAYGRWWYEESSKAILKAVGGDVNEARKFAATLAILSPQMKVDANTSIALKAWAQYKAGVPIDVKTKVQNEQLNNLLYNNIEWKGQKTNNFFINLMREIDPTSKEAQGVTVDMWMMRAFGYDNDSPTDAQYQFVEKITHQIAQKLGWEPQQVQAAIWVALKKRTEDADVKAETEAKSQELGYMHYDTILDEKTGKTKKIRVLDDPIKHRKLWLKTAMSKAIDDISKASHDNAGFNYAIGLMRNIGQVSVEAAPSRDSKILTGYYSASPELQAQFFKDVFDLFLDEDGNDELNALCGLLSLGDINAPGVWNGDVSLGLQQLVAIPTIEVDGQKVVSPEAKLALDMKCALLGYFLRQDGVAWNKAVKAKNNNNANGVDLNIGRVLTDQEALNLAKAVDKVGEGRLSANDVIMVSNPHGMYLANGTVFGDNPMDNNEFRDIIKKSLEEWEADVEYNDYPYHHESNLIGNDWEKQPNGEGYTSWFERNGRLDVLRTAIDRYGEATQRLFERYSREYGWGNPGRVQTSTERQLNQTSEISDDTIEEIVDSYVVSKKEAEAERLTDLVLSEMRHSIDYPQRDYSTVATPDLLYNLRAEARASSSIEDFMIKAEEDFGVEGQEFDLDDLQNIWDDVHAVELSNQDYGTLTEPNREVEDKVSQFTDILSDKASFEEFLKSLQNSTLEGASLFMNNLVSRLSGDNSLNTEGFRIAYGQVLESPEMYMDLYGQATDNEYWKVSAESGGQIADEMSDEFKEISRRDINEIASAISDSTVRNALISGEEKNVDGAVEKALEDNKKKIDSLKEEKKGLEGQDISEDENDASDLQRVNKNAKKLLDNAQKYMNERSKEFSEEIRSMFPDMDEDKFAKRFPTIVKALNGEEDLDSEENFRKLLEDTDLMKDQISQLLQKYRTVISARKNLEKARAIAKAKQSVRYQEAIKRKNLRTRLEKVNQQLKDAYKERQNLKKAKAIKAALARKIMRPVSNNVNWKQARQIIKIQSQIDPNFTSRMRVGGEMMDIKAVRWLYTENPENPIFASLSAEKLAKILNTNLNDMTIDQLQTLAMVVDQIRSEGLRERQAYIDAQARVVQMWRDRFIAELQKTGRVSDNPPMKGSQEEADNSTSFRQKLRNVNYALLNMARKAQILDNHQKGSFYDLLIRMKRDVFSDEYRAVEKRTSPIEELMKKNKIDFSDFYTNHTINVDGWKTQTLSFSQLLYYYLSANNEKNRQALAYGNLVTDAEKSGPNGIKARADSMAFDTAKDRNRWINGQVRALGDARYKQIYDQAKTIIESKPELQPVIKAIEADLNSDAFERVREIMLKVFNQEVGKEDYYLPMRRNNLKGKSAEEMLYEDILKTVPGTRASRTVKKGMTEDRIVISPFNQSSIEADFVKVWADSVTDQEHLVSTLEYSKLLNSIFGNSQESATLKSYIQQAYGDAMMKDIQTHISEIANPNQAKDISSQDEIIRYLRGGLYSAYLGFKSSIIVNQAITSPAAFLGKVNILKLMKGYMTMMAHPVQMWNTICELSPLMKSRSLDPTRQMIKDEREASKMKSKTGNKVKDAMSKVKDVSNVIFNDVGLKGLDWIDRFCVAGGWWAVYQDELSKMDGGDLEANQKEAARKADEFVYETQPLSDKTELAPFFKNKNQAVNLLTQFQTSLNVVWNNVTFDIPQQLGISGKNFKEKLKNGEFIHALGMITGYAVSGALLLLVTEGFDDDDDEKDKAKKLAYSFFNQPIASIPLVSNAVDYALKRTITGDKGIQFNSSNYPLFDKMVRVPYNIAEGDWEKAWTNTWQSIALANGLPYSSINELLRIKDNGLGSLLGRRDR